jgi:hypothetical protein
MGIFLSLSGVIHKDLQQVEASVTAFIKTVGGGLEPGDIEYDHPNLALIGQHGNNTTVVYPEGFVEWDDASAFLSKELDTSVFSLHIHDEDLWMFQLFHKGELITRFNPIPDYWQDDLSPEEKQSWQGNPELVSQYVPGVSTEKIAKYFMSWDWDEDDEGDEKAYPEDMYEYGDCWQLIDFMEKLGLEYPIDEEGNIHGQKYKFWTKHMKLED